MNSKNIIGIAFVVAAAVLAVAIGSSAGEAATRLFGKAVWYAPYALAIGSVRFFRAGMR